MRPSPNLFVFLRYFCSKPFSLADAYVQYTRVSFLDVRWSPFLKRVHLFSDLYALTNFSAVPQYIDLDYVQILNKEHPSSSVKIVRGRIELLAKEAMHSSLRH